MSQFSLRRFVVVAIACAGVFSALFVEANNVEANDNVSANNYVAATGQSLAAGKFDWPSYRKDNTRVGSTTEKLPIDKFGLLWEHSEPFFPLPAWHGPAKWNIFGGGKKQYPLRDFDIVFHTISVGKNLYFSSTVTGAVHCLDVQTGKNKWSFPTIGIPRIAPTYHQGKLYFGCDRGYVYCIDALRGKQVWRFTPPSKNNELFMSNGSLTSPWACRTGVLIYEGKAYAAFAGHPWNSGGIFASKQAPRPRQKKTTQPKKPKKPVNVVKRPKSNTVYAIDITTGKGSPITGGSGNTYQGYMARVNQGLVVPAGRGASVAFPFPGKKIQELKLGRTVFFVPTGEVKKDIHCFIGSHHGGISFLHMQKRTTVKCAGRRYAGNKKYFFVASESKVTCHAIADLEKALLNPKAPPKKKAKKKNTSSNVGSFLSVYSTNVVKPPKNKGLKVTWSKNVVYPCELIVAGDLLIAGGHDRVAIIQGKTGKVLRVLPVEGKAYGLAVANGKLFVSTDDGKIYCFGQGGKRVKSVTKSAHAIRQPRQPDSMKLSEYPTTAGPFIRFTGRNTARVFWKADGAKKCLFHYGEGETKLDQTLTAQRVNGWYEVHLTGLHNRRLYSCQLEIVTASGVKKGKLFDCDTWFNFSVPTATQPKGAFGARVTKMLPFAEKLLKRKKTNRGVCLVAGVTDGSLLHALAMKSELRIIGLLADEKKWMPIAKQLVAAGSYGSRVTLYSLNDFAKAEFPKNIANLLVVRQSHGMKNVTMNTVLHFLHPNNGVAVLEQSGSVTGKSWTALSMKSASDISSSAKTFDAPSVEHFGAWSHQLGDSANTASSKDPLLGMQSMSEMKLQWIGRPGARFHLDRSTRSTGPLAMDGVLVSQGMERIVALDNWNGEPLWGLEIPGMMRYNIPRHCANYCTNGKHLFVAARDSAYAIDLRAGTVGDCFKPVARRDKSWVVEWGCINTSSGLLLGTAVKTGAMPYTIKGKNGWYDGKGSIFKINRKVLADSIFVYKPGTKKPLWNYAKGLIINSTICVHQGKVYFIESMNKMLLSGEKRHLLSPLLWDDAYLTVLDIKSGRTIKSMPLPKEVYPGFVMGNISAKGDRILIWTSCAEWFLENRKTLRKRNPNIDPMPNNLKPGGGFYSLVSLDTRSWKVVWSSGKQAAWEGGHHGHHMKYPLILENKVLAGSFIFDFYTGHLYRSSVPKKTCGAYAGCASGLYGGTFWNCLTEELTAPGYGRANCWLSTLPANGLLTSVEGSGGCHCYRGNPYIEVSYCMSMRKPLGVSFAMPDDTFVGTVDVKIAKLREYGTVRYTTNGREPTGVSPVCPKTGVRLTKTATVKVGLFVDGKLVSTVMTRRFEKVKGK